MFSPGSISVFDGLFRTIAELETAASLKGGTTAPTAAQRPLIESALKPDPRVTPAGVQEPFKEGVAAPCAPATWIPYLAQLRDVTPPLIDAALQATGAEQGQGRT